MRVLPLPQKWIVHGVYPVDIEASAGIAHATSSFFPRFRRGAVALDASTMRKRGITYGTRVLW